LESNSLLLVRPVLLILFFFRLCFLLAGLGLCAYGLVVSWKPNLPWIWPAGYAFGFALSVVLLIALWKSFKALKA